MIDFSDNEIQSLDGFPLMERLTGLLICNNRISEISPSLGSFLPNLTHLTLTNNLLKNLADLNPLASLTSLVHLSLLKNAVTKERHYRLYVVHINPRIRLLDYCKVSAAERAQAKTVFTAGSLASASASMHFDADAPLPSSVLPRAGPKLSEAQLALIRAALKSAQSLEEITRLEAALRSGVVPDYLLGAAVADATPADAAAAAGGGAKSALAARAAAVVAGSSMDATD